MIIPVSKTTRDAIARSVKRSELEEENEQLRAALQRVKDWHDGLTYVEKPIIEFPLAMIETALKQSTQ